MKIYYQKLQDTQMTLNERINRYKFHTIKSLGEKLNTVMVKT